MRSASSSRRAVKKLYGFASKSTHLVMSSRSVSPRVRFPHRTCHMHNGSHICTGIRIRILTQPHIVASTYPPSRRHRSPSLPRPLGRRGLTQSCRASTYQCPPWCFHHRTRKVRLSWVHLALGHTPIIPSTPPFLSQEDLRSMSAGASEAARVRGWVPRRATTRVCIRRYGDAQASTPLRSSNEANQSGSSSCRAGGVSSSNRGVARRQFHNRAWCCVSSKTSLAATPFPHLGMRLFAQFPFLLFSNPIPAACPLL